jgi:hypothetical protein
MNYRGMRIAILCSLGLILSLSCSQSSPAQQLAAGETSPAPADGDVEAPSSDGPAGDTADDALDQPVEYTSVTLSGGLTVTQHRYDEASEICNPFPPGVGSCNDVHNPCPVEGGGGGGANEDCLALPDFCYECMPDFGAVFFLSIFDPSRNYLNPSSTRFEIDIDARRNVLRFDWGSSLSSFRPEMIMLTSDPGSFYTEWYLSNPNIEAKNPAYISVQEAGISFKVSGIRHSEDYTEYQVTDIQGSGTWEIGHSALGVAGSGTWTLNVDFYVVNP